MSVVYLLEVRDLACSKVLFISYRSESTSEVGLLGRDQVMRRTTRRQGAVACCIIYLCRGTLLPCWKLSTMLEPYSNYYAQN